MTHPRYPLSLACLACAALAVGCDEELCGFGKVGGLRCEGDVHVYCPGGWGTIDFTANREDCREQGKVCVRYERYGQPWTHCEESLGSCEPATFRPYCRVSDEAADYASLVQCIGGHQVQVGEQCRPGPAWPPDPNGSQGEGER